MFSVANKGTMLTGEQSNNVDCSFASRRRRRRQDHDCAIRPRQLQASGARIADGSADRRRLRERQLDRRGADRI